VPLAGAQRLPAAAWAAAQHGRTAQAVKALCERAAARCQRLPIQQHAEQEEQFVVSVQHSVQTGLALCVNGEGVYDCRFQAWHQLFGRHQLKEGWASACIAT
jgi:hypothetical protein